MNRTLSNLYKFVSFVQIYPEDGIIHRYITYHNGASTVRLVTIAGLLFLYCEEKQQLLKKNRRVRFSGLPLASRSINKLVRAA